MGAAVSCDGWFQSYQEVHTSCSHHRLHMAWNVLGEATTCQVLVSNTVVSHVHTQRPHYLDTADPWHPVRDALLVVPQIPGRFHWDLDRHLRPAAPQAGLRGLMR